MVTSDYVIVGGGTAACVLARRLSEDSAITVHVVEAGSEANSPFVRIPLGFVHLFTSPRMNWCYTTVPQADAGGRSIYAPAGKLLGGSSSINGMVYMRGHSKDYDNWSDLGNDGWSYRELLPYFIKSERNAVWHGSPYHGNEGLLSVDNLRDVNAASKAFLKAAELCGIAPCTDFNIPNPDGVGIRQVTQYRGCRASAETAYLAPIRRRPNLRVSTNAVVDRIRFQGTRAVGIRYRIGHRDFEANAGREVILSAGAFGSPSILMRSGVGAARKLMDIQIPVVRDVPGVGENLQDHATVSLVYATRSIEPYGISAQALPSLCWHAIKYLLGRRGLFASNVNEAGAFVRSSPGVVRPDLQLSLMPVRRGTQSLLGYGHGYTATATLLRPASRGHVTIANHHPFSQPVIDPRYLSSDSDVATLRRGLILARQILGSSPFGEFRSTELLPGPTLQNDHHIDAYIRGNSGSAFHPVGTCAMGRGGTAVVDKQLRVHGLQGLRVVDASIMPTIVAGNTCAPTMMIAEKAADMILGRTPPVAPQLDGRTLADTSRESLKAHAQ